MGIRDDDDPQLPSPLFFHWIDLKICNVRRRHRIRLWAYTEFGENRLTLRALLLYLIFHTRHFIKIIQNEGNRAHPSWSMW